MFSVGSLTSSSWWMTINASSFKSTHRRSLKEWERAMETEFHSGPTNLGWNVSVGNLKQTTTFWEGANNGQESGVVWFLFFFCGELFNLSQSSFCIWWKVEFAVKMIYDMWKNPDISQMFGSNFENFLNKRNKAHPPAACFWKFVYPRCAMFRLQPGLPHCEAGIPWTNGIPWKLRAHGRLGYSETGSMFFCLWS